MISLALIAVALLAGYLLTLICSLTATFALASASPSFVTQNFRITPGYKRVQALIWLLSVMAGAFVACAVARATYPIFVAVVFAALLVGLLWFNTWEARQRGMAHQILMSVASLLGAAGGYGAAVRFLDI
jgi:hypothetical protein